MLRLPEHLQPEQYGHLEKGDKILEINGVPIKNQDQSEVYVGIFDIHHVYLHITHACLHVPDLPTLVGI